MAKPTPHYMLSEVQKMAADPGTRPFTVTALRGGLALGLNEQEMRQVVCSLTRRNFYKSMTTHANAKEWQDVYHGLTDDGTAVYIKITCYSDRPPVFQFKGR